MNTIQDFLTQLPFPVKRCPFRSLSGWKKFLAGEKLEVTIKTLQEALVRSNQKYPPRGKKLGMLRRTLDFTVDGNGVPFRTEEALERFICAANPECRNQIPVGGKKESVDLAVLNITGGIKTLIELKPWKSQNTPLYAVIEVLKNALKFADIPGNFSTKPKCTVLALATYYQRHFAHATAEGLDRFEAFAQDLASAFGSEIDLLTFSLEWEEFLEACKPLQRSPGRRSSLFRVSVKNVHPNLMPLLKKNWLPYRPIVGGMTYPPENWSKSRFWPW